MKGSIRVFCRFHRHRMADDPVPSMRLARDPAAKKPLSLAGLSTRVGKLEAVAWRLKQAEDGYTTAAVPALVDATNAAHDRLAEAQKARMAQVEEKMERFAYRVRVALQTLQQQRADEVFALKNAAAADAKEASLTVRDLLERQARLEARLSAVVHEQSRATGRAAADSAAAVVASGGGTPAHASAQAAAAAASKAFEAAEAAERAASATQRNLETVVAQQQKALDAAAERERKLGARIDALTQALSEQHTSTSRACEAEARQREGLAQRLLVLEHRLEHGLGGDVRGLKLMLRNLAIDTGAPTEGSH
jgi:hypothetical protein